MGTSFTASGVSGGKTFVRPRARGHRGRHRGQWSRNRRRPGSMMVELPHQLKWYRTSSGRWTAVPQHFRRRCQQKCDVMKAARYMGAHTRTLRIARLEFELACWRAVELADLLESAQVV